MAKKTKVWSLPGGATPEGWLSHPTRYTVLIIAQGNVRPTVSEACLCIRASLHREASLQLAQPEWELGSLLVDRGGTSALLLQGPILFDFCEGWSDLLSALRIPAGRHRLPDSLPVFL